MLVSILRGMVREVLSLGGWLAAFWAASGYCVELAALLPQAIPGQTLRLLAAFVILFLGVLLLAALVTIAFSEFARTLGLGAMDRMLGAFFGLARGIVILAVLVLLAGLTALPRQPFWQNAMLSAPLEALVISAKPWLPGELAGRISYGAPGA